MAKSNRTYWYLGGAAAVVAVGYLLVRKSKSDSGSDGSTRSSSLVEGGSTVETVSIQRDTSYIVVFGFSDVVVLSDVEKDLQAWSTDIKQVGSTKDIEGKTIGATFQVTARRWLHIDYPTRVNTASGRTYDVLAIRKAGTA